MVVTERDELREKIAGEIEFEIRRAIVSWNDRHTARAFADRILALLPPQPKLEWRGDCLILGANFCTGYVSDGAPTSWDGYVNEEMVVCDVPLEEARAAVEQAVKGALGWTR